MSAVVATSSKPTLKALLGAPSRPHYRRSTTTKAPRKRTFVNLIMEKHNPGVRSAGSGSLLCKATASSASELLASACCGGNDNNVRGKGNGGSNRPPRGPGGGDSGSAGQPQPQPAPRALVVGAAALLAGLVLLPSQQAAASGPGLPRALRVAGAAPKTAAPRNMCLNNDNNNSNSSGVHAADGAILYGSVVLSDAERRLMARSSRQLFFSEYVRVGAGGSSAVAARV